MDTPPVDASFDGSTDPYGALSGLSAEGFSAIPGVTGVGGAAFADTNGYAADVNNPIDVRGGMNAQSDLLL